MGVRHLSTIYCVMACRSPCSSKKQKGQSLDIYNFCLNTRIYILLKISTLYTSRQRPLPVPQRLKVLYSQQLSLDILLVCDHFFYRKINPLHQWTRNLFVTLIILSSRGFMLKVKLKHYGFYVAIARLAICRLYFLLTKNWSIVPELLGREGKGPDLVIKELIYGSTLTSVSKIAIYLKNGKEKPY